MNTDKTNTDKDNDMDNFKIIISDPANQEKLIQFLEKNAPENNTKKFKDALKEFKDNNNEENIINIAKLLVAIKDVVDKQKITGGKKHKTRKYKKKGKKKKGKKKTMKKRGKKSRK